MSTKFMTIIKKSFEEDYNAFREGEYVRLYISDKYRIEKYDLYLKVNSECTGHNMQVINGDTGEYLMSLSIRPVIFPDDYRFMYDINYVAEDFNHTRKYSDDEFAYFVMPMNLYE